MLTTTRTRAVAAGAALAATAVLSVAPAAGATTRPAPAPCTATAVSTGSETAVLLRGHFSESGAFDVFLTCHIVQGGVAVVSRTDELSGPVAALASDERIPPGPFTVCYEILSLHLWGWDHRTDCF